MAQKKESACRIHSITVTREPAPPPPDESIQEENHPILRLTMPPEGKFFHRDLPSDMQEAIERIVAGVKEFKDRIDLPSGVDPRQAFRIVNAEWPELFMLDNRYHYCFTDRVSYLAPQYVCTPEEARESQGVIEKGVSRIVRVARTRPNTVEKLRYIHNWFAVNQKYDFSEPKPKKRYTPVGVFQDHLAVCAGFARAFQLVCKRLGIPSGYVFGNTKKTAKVTHAWNIVWIGESIYHIDLTSAVSQYSSNHVLGYPCFLQTAEEILRWRFVMEPFPRAENPAGNYLTSLGYRFDSQADLEKILRSFSRDQNRRSISLQSGPAFTAVDEVQRVLRQALKGFAIGCSYSTFSTGVCVVTKSPRRKKYEARVVKYNG